MLETGEGYRAEAVAAVRALELPLHEPRVGVLTPVRAFGATFASIIPGPRYRSFETIMTIRETAALDINGSHQTVCRCAERTGLPPLLIVQAGPGLPLLHEMKRFQRHLQLEKDFLVSYWDQRGCGNASRQDAMSVSLQQQVDDLRAILRWLHNQTKQAVVVFGISLGATIVLLAAEHEPDTVKAVIAVSPDANTARSDASVYSFLQEQSVRARSRRLSGRVTKLGRPPYTDSNAFQRRASLLADLGTIECGKTFSGILRESLFGMLRTYGPVGTVKTLRNLSLIQGKLLPELVSLDLFAHPPRLAVPVHYVFGDQDALTPAAVVKELPAAIAAPVSTVLLVPDAGHMVHFDQPEIVRSIAVAA
jgi:pimeloyl-ACP methyl ester carboxylesterase